MLERGKPDILDFKANLKETVAKNQLSKSALVLSTGRINPEQIHLIELAASNSEHLIVLLPNNPNDLVRFEERAAELNKLTAQLANVSILSGGPYVLSQDTFPSYFMSQADHFQYYASLDIDLFGRHIAPALGITQRWIQTDSTGENTQYYNQLLREAIEPLGIKVSEINIA